MVSVEATGAAPEGGDAVARRKGPKKKKQIGSGGAPEGGDAAVPRKVLKKRKSRLTSDEQLPGAGSQGGAPEGGDAAVRRKVLKKRKSRPTSDEQLLGAGSQGFGSVGGEEGEECTGMLLKDLVNSPDLADAQLGRAPQAPRRKRKSKVAKPGAGEEEPPASTDEEGEEAAGGEQLMQAVNRLSGLDKAAGKPTSSARTAAQPESEFHLGAVGEEVSVEDLLAPLIETPTLGTLRKQLEGLAKTETVAEPATEIKRTTEERIVEYKKTVEDARKWIPVLLHHRYAEQNVLGEEPRYSPNISTLVSETKPEDDFEKELEEATKAAGSREEDFKSAKALPMNPRVRDEQQRQQVAKLKALLFREQSASKRVKKIKSKAYHRIERRAAARDREALLQRLDVENPELAKTLREEYVRKYAERRTLRHRNARRKWAQTMQRFAKGDKGVQKEISKQAQAAHDEERGLRRAIAGRNPDQSDDSEAADLSGSDSDGEGGVRKGVAKATIDKAKKLTLGELKGLEKGDQELPTTGLLGMNFMRKAIKEKREEAQREAKDVLQELEGLDRRLEEAQKGEDGSDDEEEKKEQADKAKEDTEALAPKKEFTMEELAQARREVDKMFDQEDAAVECSVSGPLTVRGLEKAVVQAAPQSAPAAVGSATAAPVSDNPWLDLAALQGLRPPDAAPADAKPRTGAQASAAAKASEGGAKKRAGVKKKRKASAEPRPAKDEEEEAGAEEHVAPVEAQDVLNVLNADSRIAQEQRDLVRTVFVEGTQAEDFEHELEEIARKKEEGQREPEGLAGWGHWTGVGAPAPKPPRNSKPKPPKPKASVASGANEAPKKSFVQVYEGETRANHYFAANLPYGVNNPDHYDMQMRMPLGPEWVGLNTHMQRVKPRNFVKVGAIVPPLQYVKHLPELERKTAMEMWTAKRPEKLKARL